MNKTDRLIKALKPCTKALMKLSFKDFDSKDGQKELSPNISNQNILTEND